MMAMLETDLTSDILIYNLLRSTEDPFIKEYNIKFIDRSVPAEENNTIYIANIDLETRKETFQSVEYRSLINIYIKTKQTDYLEASQYLRTVAKHIKNVLKSNVTMKRRHIQFRNLTFEYGSTYTLKGLHLIVQVNEMESLNGDDPVLIDKLMLDNIETYVVTDDLYWKQKNRQK